MPVQSGYLFLESSGKWFPIWFEPKANLAVDQKLYDREIENIKETFNKFYAENKAEHSVINVKLDRILELNIGKNTIAENK